MKKTKYTAVLFDLDGTLLNTLGDLANAGNYAMKTLGFPTHETEEYRYFVGNGIPKLIERILPDGADENTKTRAYDIFSEYYEKNMYVETAPYTGITELLQELAAAGIKTACVTNKAQIFSKQMIERYFGTLIGAVCGAGKDKPKKPAPDTANEAIAILGADKAHTLFVGDSSVDMLTARNVGVDSCGVLWGFRTRGELLENGAMSIAENVGELAEVLGVR